MMPHACEPGWHVSVCPHLPYDAAMVCPVQLHDTHVTTRRCLLVEAEVALRSALASGWKGDR